MKKTLQTNIAMNDPYDTVLDPHCLVSYGSFTVMLVVFFFQFYQNVCYYCYICICH